MDKRSLVLRWGGGFLVVAGMVIVVIGGLRTWGAGASAPVPTPSPTLTVAAATVAPSATPSPRPTLTPEPIVPTRTPVRATPSPSATSTPRPTATWTATATATATETAPATREIVDTTTSPSPTVTPEATAGAPTATPTISPATPTAVPPTAAAPPNSGSLVVPAGERWRLGVSLPYGAAQSYDLEALQVGWVMDWRVQATTALPAGVAYAQTVGLGGGQLRPDAATLTAVAAARPGSIWLISNEPDVRWQNNIPAQTYALLYREAYQAIKAGDPSAVVTAGGIAQPTELRLRYLDIVLQTYQETFGEPLPAQAWQIHNYMLREERDSWGVDIPPGFSENTGALYAVEDSGNLELFKAQIVTFRRWMANRGYRNLPLFITEYGIPMPADYGFPPSRVAQFLEDVWRYLLTASDPALGLPSDGNRLVQRWCWFSMGVPSYPTGNLIDPETGAWTPLARAWMSLVGR